MFGRVRAPKALRSLLEPGERLLAVADGEPAGDHRALLAATVRGLLLPGEDGWRHVSWSTVVKATWDAAGLEVVEGTADEHGVVTDRPPVRYRLTEPRNLPVVVRQRVERSIARQEQVRVPGGTARVIARRRPGVDGLHWTARLDSGTPDTPDVRQALAGYLDRVREQQADLSA